MHSTNLQPLTITLLLTLAVLVACSAPGATTTTPEPPVEEPSPTLVTETPDSTATETATAEAQPTETATSEVEETPAPTVTPSHEAGEESPLANSQWTLVSFGPSGEETPVVPGTTVTLQFDAAGQAGGSGGCNTYGMDYQAQGNILSIGTIISTEMACLDEDTMDQEQRYFAALQAAGEFELTAEELTIWYDDGQGVLNFAAETARPDPVGTPEGVQDVEIRHIEMLDGDSGWAIGRLDGAALDRVLLTTDGGETWQDFTPDAAGMEGIDPAQDISAAGYFDSPQEAWVAYSRVQPAAEEAPPKVWITNDGGQTWESSAPLEIGDMPFEFFGPSDLDSIDGQFGWLMAHLGAGMSHDYIAIFTTGDGGQNWQRVTDPNSNPEIQSCNKSGLVFTAEDEAWLAGNCPGLMQPLFLYHTTDGGATWAQTDLPAAEGLPAEIDGALGDRCGIPQMESFASETLVLTLRCFDFEQETSQVWLYTTSDGGNSWQAQPLPEPAGAFTFVDSNEGWYLAADESQPEQDGRVYHSNDGGASWQELAQVPGQGQAQIDFADSENGWIIVGFPPDRTLFHSIDGGASWQPLTPVVASH